jgi:hypothetical protein
MLIVQKMKFYSNLMVWWKSLRYSKVRCKYVDSSKNVKFYSNLMVWWRSLRHSNQREKSKEGTGVTHPEAQIATWNSSRKPPFGYYTWQVSSPDMWKGRLGL